jgi:murein DD-endopeptidase MepM/ murein hydrolase activator NlpD
MLKTKAAILTMASLIAQSALAEKQKIILSQGKVLKVSEDCSITSIPRLPIGILEEQQSAKKLNRTIVKASSRTKDLADYVLKIDSKKFQLPGQYIQSHMNDEDYAVLKCKTQNKTETYLIFDIYSSDNVDALAQAAIATDSNVFKTATLMSSEEAEEEVEDLASKEETNRNTLATQNNVSSVTANTAHSSLQTVAQVQNGVVLPSSQTQSSIMSNTTTPGASSLKFDVQPLDITPSNATVVEQEDVIKGGIQNLLCTQGDTVNLRSDNLNRITKTLLPLQKVKVMQSWNAQTKVKDIDGKQTSFVQIQTTDEKNKIISGWVAQDLVKTKAECVFAQEMELARSRKKVKIALSGKDGGQFIFPTIGRPTASYKSGMRMFGARRSKGRRVHAATDLYRNHGERIRAVTSGLVLRDMYKFYQGTYALEVKHPGFIIRYGENTGREAVGGGDKVAAGETIAYMGTVNSGCCEPMLHLEMYSGKSRGPLSQMYRRGFQRRADLINPTRLVSQWERQTFGSSY